MMEAMVMLFVRQNMILGGGEHQSTHKIPTLNIASSPSFFFVFS